MKRAPDSSNPELSQAAHVFQAPTLIPGPAGIRVSLGLGSKARRSE